MEALICPMSHSKTLARSLEFWIPEKWAKLLIKNHFSQNNNTDHTVCYNCLFFPRDGSERKGVENVLKAVKMNNLILPHGLKRKGQSAFIQQV